MSFTKLAMDMLRTLNGIDAVAYWTSALPAC